MGLTQADCPDAFNPVAADHCGGNACQIWVQVVWNGQTCVAQVGTGKMTVHGMPNEVVTVRWNLPASSKWMFKAEPSSPPPAFATPITFKKPAQNPASVFSNLVVRDTQVTLDDKLVERGPFDYHVRVYKRNADRPVVLDSPDPAMYNDF